MLARAVSLPKKKKTPCHRALQLFWGKPWIWPLVSCYIYYSIIKWRTPEKHLSAYLLLCISQRTCCTSSMPEMLLTPSFLRENCSFLSSAVAVLCTTFFFLRADPYRAQQQAMIYKLQTHRRRRKHLPACTPTHLAAYADLRLQFGELLLVHYRLLHLTQETYAHNQM